MTIYAEKSQENKSRPAAKAASHVQGVSGSSIQFKDRRSEMLAQKNLQAFANQSPQINQFSRMQTIVNQRRENEKASLFDVTGQRSLKKGSPSSSACAVQMARMNATEAELTDNEERETACDIFHNTLNSQVMIAEYGINLAAGVLTITRYSDGANLSLDQLLTNVWTTSYGGKPGPWKAAVREELKARFQVYGRTYNGRGNRTGAIEPSEDPDIEADFNAGRACVITALMYAEGGSVMGASSVEELHRTLTTRFPASWAQYSDDNVIPSLYGHFGYASTAVDGKLPAAVTAANYAAGMVSDGGHMVGFRKQGDGSYNFRDNESVESPAAGHPKRNSDAEVIWHK